MRRRNIAILVVLCSAWLYVIVRAASVAIVHDESITYGILRGDPTFAEQANNHWLNTSLMRVSRYFFGDSEFALRMPNVLAFPMYAAAVGLILWRLRFAAQAVGVALLVVTPFVLEFFGLARGYGLGLAFVAVLAAAIVAEGHHFARLAVGTAAGVLAFYASFGSLTSSLQELEFSLSSRCDAGPWRPSHCLVSPPCSPDSYM